MTHFCTQDATSEVTVRLGEAIHVTSQKISPERLERIRAVQKKVDYLNRIGVLKRQVFAASKHADFQRIHLKKS